MQRLLFSFLLLAVIGLSLGKFFGDSLRERAVSSVSFFHLEDSLIEKLEEENRYLRKALSDLVESENEVLTDLGPLGGLLARVVYHPPSLWFSCVWVDIGEENGSGLVRLNSPVVREGALVGLVDYVGKKQSRVRLITDSLLTPSVRVARGDPQRLVVVREIERLLDLLNRLSPPIGVGEMPKDILKGLEALKKLYLPEGKRWLLAKGELKGSGSPLWESRGHILKGTGFNLEFGDDYSPARYLATGLPYDLPEGEPIPLIQPDDLLVTTGLDGIFPEGLDVAVVTRVNPLREGDVFYTLEAKPLFGSPDILREVEILQPVSFDLGDLPPYFKKK